MKLKDEVREIIDKIASFITPLEKETLTNLANSIKEEEEIPNGVN